MHFTRGPDKSSPTLHLPGQIAISAPKTIRWLGFYLDRHLNFTHHTQIMANRAAATTRAMKILGNTVKGMSHVQIRQLTISTIIPTLTYGCQLWWGNRFTKSNTARLQRGLNGALRLTCRAFKTTPIKALQHISHIPPIELTIKKLCYGASIRLHRLLPSSPVLQRIPKPTPTIHINHREANTKITVRTPQQCLSPLQRIAEMSNATNEPTLNSLYNAPWEPDGLEHPRITTVLPPKKEQRDEYNKDIKKLIKGLETRPDTLVICTDGSRRRVSANPNRAHVNPRNALAGLLNEVPHYQANRRRRLDDKKRRTGAGLVIKQGQNIIMERRIGVGKKSNVYDAESLALMASMQLASQYCGEHTEIRTIYLLADSSSALKNITKTNPHPTQLLSAAFIKYAQTFLEANPNNEIRLKWIPGHQGHALNERADHLARKGCKQEHEALGETLSYHSERKSSLINIEWGKQLRVEGISGPFGDVTVIPATTKPNAVFLQLSNKPEVFGRLTQIRTMHGHNTYYYNRFNLDRDLHCPCGDLVPPDVPAHIQDHTLHCCEAFKDHRHILTEASRDHNPMVLLGSVKGLIATAKFLESSGAFTSEGKPYARPPPPEFPQLRLHLTPEEIFASL
jgi:ribonuclease HI